MVEMMIEVLVIAVTLAGAGLLRRKNATMAGQVFAAAFILMIGVGIAFCVAQGAAAAGLLSVTLSFSPIEILSLAAVIYWISFLAEKGKMFNRELG